MPDIVPVNQPSDRLSTLDATAYARWSVISRDEQFRSFDPERIARAIGKAISAADGGELSAAGRTRCAELCRRVCEDLARRRANGGSFYLEEIQDLVELTLMRSGEHEAARRFVLRRRMWGHAPTVAAQVGRSSSVENQAFVTSCSTFSA